MINADLLSKMTEESRKIPKAVEQKIERDLMVAARNGLFSTEIPMYNITDDMASRIAQHLNGLGYSTVVRNATDQRDDGSTYIFRISWKRKKEST